MGKRAKLGIFAAWPGWPADGHCERPETSVGARASLDSEAVREPRGGSLMLALARAIMSFHD